MTLLFRTAAALSVVAGVLFSQSLLQAKNFYYSTNMTGPWIDWLKQAQSESESNSEPPVPQDVRTRCLKRVERVAWTARARIVTNREVSGLGPVVPYTKLHLTSGIHGLLILTDELKPASYSTIVGGNSGFGFSRPTASSYEFSSELGKLLGLQYTGSGEVAFAAFYRDNHTASLVVVHPRNSASGEMRVAPELKVHSLKLPGGATYFHMSALPNRSAALLIEGGVQYRFAAIKSAEEGLLITPPAQLNLPPRFQSLEEMMNGGFHWRAFRPLSGEDALFLTTIDNAQNGRVKWFVTPGTMNSSLELNANWARTKEVKSKKGESPISVRFHPTEPLFYAIYADHYELYYFNAEGASFQRLGTFDYPESVKGVLDVHFYRELIDPETGEFEYRIAGLAKDPAHPGRSQVYWWDTH